MDPRQQLWITVDRLLWEEWDPIGVNDYGGPDDEYRGYVPELIDLLIRDASTQEIADRLSDIATKQMDLFDNKEHHMTTANKLKALATS